jgi:hypothetical protein
LGGVVTESLFKISDERIGVPGLDYHIIHTSHDILVELFLEIGLDSSLIVGASIFQPERHCCVALSAKRGDERGLLPVFFLDSIKRQTGSKAGRIPPWNQFLGRSVATRRGPWGSVC